MLPKKNRIPSKCISNILQKNDYIHSPFFVIYTKKINKQDKKYAVIVGKKVSKRATKRNYLKRVSRNVIIENIGNLKEGVAFVLVLKKPTDSASFQEIKEKAEKLFMNAGVINK